jgi:rhodanese-related sulfurtransferase
VHGLYWLRRDQPQRWRFDGTRLKHRNPQLSLKDFRSGPHGKRQTGSRPIGRTKISLATNNSYPRLRVQHQCVSLLLCQLWAEPSLQETFLIDVREPDETVQGMIPSAVNVPLSELSNAFALPAVTWKEKFNFEKPRRDQEVIFYCRSGKRSSSAADVAKRNGFTKCVVAISC